MKTTFRRLQCGILAVAWLLAGCNSDVFIDKFLSAEPSVSLSEGSRSALYIQFPWDVEGVFIREPFKSTSCKGTTERDERHRKFCRLGHSQTPRFLVKVCAAAQRAHLPKIYRLIIHRFARFRNRKKAGRPRRGDAVRLPKI